MMNGIGGKISRAGMFQFVKEAIHFVPGTLLAAVRTTVKHYPVPVTLLTP